MDNFVQVCRGRKQTMDEFAQSKCEHWSNTLGTVKLTGEGKRFKQEPSIGSWMSCAIFCKTDKNQWFTPALTCRLSLPQVKLSTSLDSL